MKLAEAILQSSQNPDHMYGVAAGFIGDAAEPFYVVWASPENPARRYAWSPFCRVDADQLERDSRIRWEPRPTTEEASYTPKSEH